MLVVDDDPNMVELITRILCASNRRYQVLKAYDGAAALDVLQRPDQRVDLLILDLLMPPPDGLAVLSALRADPRLADLPVIVVSARGFIDRGVASSVLAVTREHGLSIRELMACAQALLQTLNPPGRTAEGWSNARS